MKPRAFVNSCLSLLFAAFAFSAMAEGDYVLKLGDKSIDVSLGEKQTVTLTNGQQVTVLLTKKDVLTFQNDSFSFRHKSTFSPSKSDLGNDVRQTMMTTALGTGIIVQDYGSLDPSSMIDLMVNELTKEEIRAGYKKEEKAVEKKLPDGTVLKGKTVVTTYKDDQWTRSVLASGSGEKGILVVTFIEKSNLTEQPMIDLFWESLRMKKR